jgi:hypothetical protein
MKTTKFKIISASASHVNLYTFPSEDGPTTEHVVENLSKIVKNY